MSATIAALLVGTAAVGGFGAWAGSSSSTEVPTPKEALQQVSEVVAQEEEPSQPTSSTPPPTPIAEPVPEVVPEPVPEVVPAEETKEEEKVPEPVPTQAVPETTNMEGGSKQDGGFGKPTWAPLNSGISLQSAMGLTKEQIGSTGSSLLSKWTGAKTAESIQLKLKEIDDQLRVLKAQEFTTKSKLDKNISEMKLDPTNIDDGPQEDPKNTLRGRYMKEYNTYLTSKTLFDYNSKLISKIVDEKKDQDTEEKSLKDLYKERFPEKADQFDDPSNKVELFEFINRSRNLPENLIPKKTKKGSPATPDSWWSSLNNKTSGNKDSDPSKLTGYLSAREKHYTDYSTAEENMNKYKDKFEELDSSIKELTPKLKNIQKKIKELLDTRELVLVELSNYELPKGMFESFIKQKSIKKPSTLPTGEDRDRIIAQIKDYEQRIKEKKEELNDELDKQLNTDSSWKPAADNTDEYGRLSIAIKDLEKQRDNEILKLEGRTPEQKAGNDLDNLVRELLKDKLVDKNGITNTFVESDFPKVYKSYLEISKSSIEDIHANIDKYYNFYVKSKTIGFATFKGEDISRAFTLLFLLNKPESKISSNSKEKVKEFILSNKLLIFNTLINLELALQGIKTPTEEQRTILQQSIESGESFATKAVKRAFTTTVGKWVGSFSQTEKAKLERLIQNFRERIVDKTKTLYVKYGLWGKQVFEEYEKGIDAMYDENKQLLIEEFNKYGVLTQGFFNDAVPPIEKQKLKPQLLLSINRIKGFARLIMTLIQKIDPLYGLLDEIIDSSEYDIPFRGGAKIMNIGQLHTKFQEILDIIRQENNNERIFQLDISKILIDQLNMLVNIIRADTDIFNNTLTQTQNINNKREKLITLGLSIIQKCEQLEKILNITIQNQTTEQQKSELLELREDLQDHKKGFERTIKQFRTEGSEARIEKLRKLKEFFTTRILNVPKNIWDSIKTFLKSPEVIIQPQFGGPEEKKVLALAPAAIEAPPPPPPAAIEAAAPPPPAAAEAAAPPPPPPPPPPALSQEVLEQSAIGLAEERGPAQAPPAPPPPPPPAAAEQPPPQVIKEDQGKRLYGLKKDNIDREVANFKEQQEQISKTYQKIRKSVDKIQTRVAEGKLKPEQISRFEDLKKKVYSFKNPGTNKVSDLKQILSSQLTKLETAIRKFVFLIKSFIDPTNLQPGSVPVTLPELEEAEKKTTREKEIILDQQNRMQTIVEQNLEDLEDLRTVIESDILLEPKGGSRKNHLTRKQHWTRSKPSRFKTHRIY